MTAKISTPRHALEDRGVRSIIGQWAAAAAGAGLAAMSISAFGADPAAKSIHPIPAPSQVMGTGAPPGTNQPSVAPDATLEHFATQARMIDQLYGELMRWRPLACQPAANILAIGQCCAGALSRPRRTSDRGRLRPETTALFQT